METIIVYSVSTCTSCRKAKAWLNDQDIPYVDRNISSDPLTAEELRALLSFLPNGLEDIFSQRASIYKKLAIDINECSLNQALALMEKYPSLVKKPILKKGSKLSIGFNQESIRVFVPRKNRKNKIRIMTQETAAAALSRNY